MALLIFLTAAIVLHGRPAGAVRLDDAVYDGSESYVNQLAQVITRDSSDDSNQLAEVVSTAVDSMPSSADSACANDSLKDDSAAPTTLEGQAGNGQPVQSSIRPDAQVPGQVPGQVLGQVKPSTPVAQVPGQTPAKTSTVPKGQQVPTPKLSKAAATTPTKPTAGSAVVPPSSSSTKGGKRRKVMSKPVLIGIAVSIAFLCAGIGYCLIASRSAKREAKDPLENDSLTTTGGKRKPCHSEDDYLSQVIDTEVPLGSFNTNTFSAPMSQQFSIGGRGPNWG